MLKASSNLASGIILKLRIRCWEWSADVTGSSSTAEFWVQLHLRGPWSHHHLCRSIMISPYPIPISSNIYLPIIMHLPISTFQSINIYIYIYLSISLQVRRSSKTWSLAKDQVLRGPLVYLGLIELSPFSPHVRRISSSPIFFHSGPHCTPSFIASEPLMATENYIGSMLDLNPIWNCWCMIGKHHLQIRAPNGLFQFAMKSD